MTPELAAEMALLRQKCAQGIATREDMIAGVRLLRETRAGAAVVARSNVRAKAMGIAPINTKSILAGLGEMKK